jgi:hypothetical protein
MFLDILQRLKTQESRAESANRIISAPLNVSADATCRSYRRSARKVTISTYPDWIPFGFIAAKSPLDSRNDAIGGHEAGGEVGKNLLAGK